MTLAHFSELFALLAVQLRATDADEATIRAYYQALKDLEPELLAMAAERMGKQGGSQDGEHPHWFPKTSEWRVLATKIEGERQAIQAHRLRLLHKAGQVLCNACDDTGWAPKGGTVRYEPCDCRALRRLEVLGRRSMPMLLPEVPDNLDVIAKVEAPEVLMSDYEPRAD